MNTEELGYYLYMENEELKIKEQEEQKEEVNLKQNSYMMGEEATKDK